MHDTLTFEKEEFDLFLKELKSGKYRGQRVGQAFYNHFNLHKVSDQSKLQNIYAKDGKRAVAWIVSNCLFT